MFLALMGTIFSWFQTATLKPDLPMGVIRGCESCEDCQKVVASWRPSAGRKPCLDEAPTFFPDEEVGICFVGFVSDCYSSSSRLCCLCKVCKNIVS
jgi:hypothetical protein